jgi:hypothetical protein
MGLSQLHHLPQQMGAAPDAVALGEQVTCTSLTALQQHCWAYVQRLIVALWVLSAI